MGVKKWSKLAKEKVQAANIPLRKFAKSTEQRLAVELPQSIYLDLIGDIMPILEKCQLEYKKQLGEKHIFSRDLHSYIQSLSAMGREHGSYLHDGVQDNQNARRNSSYQTNSSFCWPCIKKKSGKVYTEKEFIRMISKKKILDSSSSSGSAPELSMLGAVAIRMDDDDQSANHVEINIS